jgi:hypothetical protein
MFLRSAPIDVDWFTGDDWWQHVDVHAPEQCWPWLQSCGSHGYGQTWDGRTVRLAHRVAWTLVHGPIPEDMTVDHICRNRRCCNPWHLRLLSNIDNARDNGPARRTHCPRGHPYDETNTYVNRRGHRICRACWRTQ